MKLFSRNQSKWFKTAMAGFVLTGMVAPYISAPKAFAEATPAEHIVISEVYGGGGNSGAQYKRDFIELYNPTDTAISLDGWSVQYASSGSTTTWDKKTELSGAIPPNGYFLIEEAAGNGGTIDLPNPDISGGIIGLAGSSGKVALVKSTTSITGKSDTNVIDFVGYGSANESETAPTAVLSNTTSAQRIDPNVDTDNNNADFKVDAPTPQSSTGTVTPPTEPPTNEIVNKTLTELRAVNTDGTAKLKGTKVRVTGVVTATLKSNSIYIQDGNAGVNIFSGVTNQSTYQLGEKLEIEGEVDFYNGLTEIVPTKITKLDTATLPQPLEKTIESVTTFSTAEALEGSLVKVTGKVTNVPTAFPGNVTIVDDSNKSLTVRVEASAGIAVADVVAGKTYEFIGVLGQFDSSSPYNSGYQLYPRSKTDITEVHALNLQHEALTQVYKGNGVTFTAVAEGAEQVTLYYRATGETSYSPVQLVKGEGNSYSVTLEVTSVPQNGFEYYIEATSGDLVKSSGSSATPNSVSLIADTFGPELTNETPMNGTKTEDKTPDISVSVQDDSGIEESSIFMTVDGTDVTATTHFEDGIVSYTPESDLALANHNVTVKVTDTKGNETIKAWTFEVVKVFRGGNHYRGSTHNHTNISHDGAGEPAEALVAAKKYNYDWFAFSDHSHDIDAELMDKDTVDRDGLPERTGGTEWETTKALSAQNTKNGEFVVFPAFEMTSTTWGHSNVFGTENFIDRKQAGGKYQNLQNYFAWILKYDNLVAQFNHPGWPEGAFNHFMPYDANIDQLFTMMEVGNGSGHYSYENTEDIYLSALELGWHVAPTYGEDNHDATWGETNVRTVIVSEDLTEASLLHSMKNLRVYMSEDPNFQLDFLANGQYMGATVEGETLKFSIKGQDAVAEDRNNADYNYLDADYVSDDRVEKVELISNGKIVIDSYAPMTKDFEWTPSVQVSGQQWFVVKVTQKDGEHVYSAPIWSEEVPYDVKVSGLGVVGDTIVSGNPVTLQSGITNLGSETIDSLEVKFYYDEVKESNLIGSQTLTNLTSKTVQTASVEWANPIAGNHDLIAVIETKGTDSATDNQFIRPVEIKEQLGITVLIDAAHKNDNTTTDTSSYKDNLKLFTKQIRNEGYKVEENKLPLTAGILADVDVLVMTQPNSSDLTAEENQAVSDFVKAGGSLFLLGKSNYRNTNVTVNNDLLQLMGSTIQIADDGIFDDSKEGNFWSDPLKSKHAVQLHPGLVPNYITDRVSFINYYSGTSLYKVGNKPLTNSNTVSIIASGNETTYQNGFKGGYSYDTVSDTTGGSAIPAIAAEKIGEGQILVAGMNILNDKQLDEGFAPVGNDEFALNAINWLAGRGTVVSKIGDARTLQDSSSVVVEGTVTSDTATFFDAFYIQDDTGGIFAYKEIPNEGALKLGDKVRVYGKIKSFEGDLELEFNTFAMDVVKIGEGEPVQPKAVTTGDASKDAIQGQLVKVVGKVVSKYDSNSYVINDGSGDILVFVDGYIANKTGAVPNLVVGEYLEAVGITSTFTDGKRIRVRDTRELKKDVTAPVTSTIVPNGWVNTNVTVELTATDTFSGVAKTFYSVNGEEFKEGTTFTVTTEGINQVSFYSVDAAGNKEATQSVEVKIDKSIPIVEMNFNDLYKLGSKLDLAYTTKDELSGIASEKIILTRPNDTFGEVVNKLSDITLDQPGVYSILVMATDVAGNETTMKKEFTVYIPVTIGVTPKVINGNKGEFTVRVVLPSKFSTQQFDLNTVTLNGVAALKSNNGYYNQAKQGQFKFERSDFNWNTSEVGLEFRAYNNGYLVIGYTTVEVKK